MFPRDRAASQEARRKKFLYDLIDQRNMGMSMRVERSNVDQVRKRIEMNKAKQNEVEKEYNRLVPEYNQLIDYLKSVSDKFLSLQQQFNEEHQVCFFLFLIYFKN